MKHTFNQPTAEQVFTTLACLARKGQNVRVEWEREAKTRKQRGPHTITKRTIAPVRYGISYANLGAIKEGIAQGLREEVGPLPWGTWRKGYENEIIDHNGVEYCRFAVGTFKNITIETAWTMNGKEVSKEKITPYLLASELRERDDAPLVFVVKAKDIKGIILED